MSQPKTAQDLYELLFETATGVKDGTVEIEKAKAIANLGQVIVNLSASEVKMRQEYGALDSSFFPNDVSQKRLGVVKQ